jgi:hypothetical protein
VKTRRYLIQYSSYELLVNSLQKAISKTRNMWVKMATIVNFTDISISEHPVVVVYLLDHIFKYFQVYKSYSPNLHSKLCSVLLLTELTLSMYWVWVSGQGGSYSSCNLTHRIHCSSSYQIHTNTLLISFNPYVQTSQEKWSAG